MREIKKLYGPYIRKSDGRKVVVIHFQDGTQTTTQYSRYIVEQNLGRELNLDETVDHINRDFTDDRLENLQILPRVEHSKIDAKRAKREIVNCIWCGLLLNRTAKSIRYNASKNRAGPFCKPCGGLYGSKLQNNKIEQLPPQPTAKPSYYYKSKDL